VHAAVDFALQKSGGLQHAEVLGDGGERDFKRRGEFADGGLAASQAGQDGAAGGIGQRAEGGVQRGVGGGQIVNHVV
jgi:hypothetical protein